MHGAGMATFGRSPSNAHRYVAVMAANEKLSAESKGVCAGYQSATKGRGSTARLKWRADMLQ